MKTIDYFKSRSVETERGCWEWQGSLHRLGYGRFGKSSFAHRGAWEAANGPVDHGLCVCHKCDNRRCVNPDHLFLGTHAENMRDMVIKGRSPRKVGSNHNMAKLTEHDVSIIKWCLDAGVQQTRLAGLYGVSKGAIGFIARGEHWKHVTAIEYVP